MHSDYYGCEGYLVGYYDGHQRTRHRASQTEGSPLVATKSMTTACIYAIEQILYDILSDDKFDLAVFLQHSQCDPEWKDCQTLQKVKVRSGPDPKNIVDVSLWSLASKTFATNNCSERLDSEADGSKWWDRHESEAEDMAANWRCDLLKTIDGLSTSEKIRTDTDLEQYLVKMLAYGFGKYDVNDGHWIDIKTIDLVLK